MKLKPLKDKISITIDNDILVKLKEKAEYDDRSLSQYINLVLKQHIKDIEEKKPWNSRLLFCIKVKINQCGALYSYFMARPHDVWLFFLDLVSE